MLGKRATYPYVSAGIQLHNHLASPCCNYRSAWIVLPNKERRICREVETRVPFDIRSDSTSRLHAYTLKKITTTATCLFLKASCLHPNVAASKNAIANGIIWVTA